MEREPRVSDFAIWDLAKIDDTVSLALVMQFINYSHG
jgi:hypothetical protein